MNKNSIARLAAIAVMAGAASLAWAQDTPAGVWKTIDDETKKEKSLVRITEADGVFTGTIDKILDPEAKPDAVCEKCTDERKGKPILGLTIIRKVTRNATDATVWDGGEVMDPNNGKTYRVRLKPVDGGKVLEVRGYFGPFYRTQRWTRVE
jgi:uncharacterized protein (DUF2147 family)